MFNSQNLQEKWAPVLEHGDLPKIENPYKKAVTAVILENQEKAAREDKAFLGEIANVTGDSAVANWDPILISLVRRAMPNLIAYDICGVQPMTGPTGLIFAMKSRFTSNSGTEALFNEADSDFNSLLKWFNENCLSNNQYLLHNKIKENFSYAVVANKYRDLINKI